ncbi:MAG: hypothetical protein IKW90_11950 [Lachnospiraceae bacterium]|nr:hypothetical protein [Lachnospiraceae bacterium]
MGILKPATCPNCGANISIVPSEKEGKCPYCGTSFLIDDAVRIYNYNYNIVNNIQTDKVIVQQEEPEYLKTLRDLKVAVDGLIKGTDLKSCNDVYLKFKREEAKRFFDKCDLLRLSALWNFLYAYTKPYCEILDLWHMNPWRSQLEQAINVCPDSQTKQKYIDMYNDLSNKEREKKDRYFLAKEKFINTIQAGLHGCWVASRKYKSKADYLKKILFWSYKGILYAISQEYIEEVTNPLSMLIGANDVSWVSEDTIYLKDFRIQYFTSEVKIIRNDLKWSSNKGMRYFNNDIHVESVIEIDNNNLEESYNRVVRFYRGECIYCGAPLEYGGIRKKHRCSANCGCKTKYIYNETTKCVDQLYFEK